MHLRIYLPAIGLLFLPCFAQAQTAIAAANLQTPAAVVGDPAQGGVPNDPAPPFVQVPGPAIDAASAAINQTLVRSIAAAHETWKQQDGGAEFQAGLSYSRGTPVLMLITSQNEPGDQALRRKRAMLMAFGFLLDSAAFDRVEVCVLGFDLKRPTQHSIANYALKRSDVQAAAKSAAPVLDLPAAIQRARGDDALVNQICLNLGLK